MDKTTKNLLTDYENLGGTKDTSGFFYATQDITGRSLEEVREAHKELCEYENRLGNGFLKMFDCGIGDTVYRITHVKAEPLIHECTVTGVRQVLNTTSYYLHADINEDTYSIWVDNWFDQCQIGHEFFLTREDAEKVLEEKRNESQV